MGYSKNPLTLRKIEDKLEPLSRGLPCAWSVEGGADRWAYLVREGLSIARRNPEKFPGLARYAKFVRVHVVNDSLVQALIDTSERSEMAAMIAPSTIPLHGVNEGTGTPRTLVSPESAAAVIEYFVRSGPSNDPLRIVQVDLDEDQKETIQKYAQSRTPAWILLEPAPGALLIVPSTPDIPPGVIWKRQSHSPTMSAGSLPSA